jgi:hypothetical protein
LTGIIVADGRSKTAVCGVSDTSEMPESVMIEDTIDCGSISADANSVRREKVEN